EFPPRILEALRGHGPRRAEGLREQRHAKLLEQPAIIDDRIGPRPVRRMALSPRFEPLRRLPDDRLVLAVLRRALRELVEPYAHGLQIPRQVHTPSCGRRLKEART